MLTPTATYTFLTKCSSHDS